MAHTPFKNRWSQSPWEKQKWKWYPVPGCIVDPLYRIGKFDRWHKRSDKAHRLYWATHPELYKKMCDTIENLTSRKKTSRIK